MEMIKIESYAGLAADSTTDRVLAAWCRLAMPDLDLLRVVQEHDRLWVIGWNIEDDRVIYSVVPASGPGTYDGIAFEEL